MLRLRPYQDDLRRKAQAALASPQARALLQLPTGAGKTRLASALLAGWLRHGGKGVWLNHRRELSAQTGQALNHSGVRAANTLHWRIDTSTPWRLAKDRGFNHLFDRLIVGPQIRELQSNDYLAQSQVLMPDFQRDYSRRPGCQRREL